MKRVAMMFVLAAAAIVSETAKAEEIVRTLSCEFRGGAIFSGASGDYDDCPHLAARC